MPAFPGINSNEVIDWAASIAGPLMVKGTGTAFTVTGTAAAGIADADYPVSTVRGIVYLDGTFYVMEPDGTIWNSLAASDDPTNWPTDGFISAEFEPDAGVCLGKCLNYVVAFGQWTTQLFWDAANPTGSPLSPVNNGVLLIGCAHAYSVAQTESTLIWVAQRKGNNSTYHKGRFVAILVGTSYEEISTPDINRILEADDLATVYSAIVELAGHTWYLLTLGTSNLTLVFDLKAKQWYVWTRLAAGAGVSVTALTQTNGLASATTSGAHGISDGDPVVLSAASVGALNGTFNVNVVGTASFTYPVSATGTSTSTGTATATPYTESAFGVVASLGYNNQQIVMDTSGNVYTLSIGTALDNGNIPINWRIRTTNLDMGNNERKFASSVAIIGDIAGTATGMVRYTDDDYRTYGYFRRFDLSQTRINQQRWGNFRRRAWEWRYTDRERFRIKQLEVELTQGVT